MNKAKQSMKSVGSEMRIAKRHWPLRISDSLSEQFKELIKTSGVSVAAGDIQLLDGKWYVTHSGLLRLARRKAMHWHRNSSNF